AKSGPHIAFQSLRCSSGFLPRTTFLRCFSMMPCVPPTSAVSPQPTRPLSVLILISRESRTSDRATDGPIALGILCSTAKVSTLVMVSPLGFFPAASATPQRPAREPARAPHEPASPALKHSRRVQLFCCMGCPLVHE